jgi:uncharacterized Zn finger protein
MVASRATIRSLRSWCPHCQENVQVRERVIKDKKKRFTETVAEDCVKCGLTLNTFERPRGGSQ